MAIKKKRTKKAPVSSAQRQSLSGPTGTGTSAENLLDQVKAYFIPGKTAGT
jgi:hypothetical protein